MAGILTNVGEDIKSLQQLRQEIENVKKALGSIDINVKIDIRKELEQKLQSLTKQYDTLVSKAAEADAKLMESAASIDKAVDTITRAQEKAAKTNSQQANATADKAQTAAVEGQAKAYIDLKDEIDNILGSREQNIRQMMQEQNAIRLINAEIAQINMSRQYGGGLTATQSQRLQQLNDSLLTHKQALAEVRQELNNNAKLDIAAVGSMNELSQSLSRMRIAYRALNEDERNSEFGQNLLKSIQEADAKIKELDATIGNHQRNVGNYQGSFNGLGMSVQQIVRELPSATMGINMFFLAISNNLPILADQIKYAKEANAAMKAAGQEPVPVWKQLVSSLLSWQTAMMVGISLLTMYGKDIIKWVKNLFRVKDAYAEDKKAAEEHAAAVKKANKEWIDSVARTASSQISEYEKLKRQYLALGNSLAARKKFIKDNEDAFHNLGFAVNTLSQAENFFIKNTSAVVNALIARAEATAYEEEIKNATQRKIANDKKAQKTVAGGGYYKVHHKGEIINERMEYQSSGTGVIAVKVADNATQAQADTLNKKEREAAKRRLKHNLDRNQKEYDEDLDFLRKGLSKAQQKQALLSKQIGVPTYEDAVKAGNVGNKVGRGGSEPKQLDYAKLAREQSDAERGLEDKVTQSRIDAMQDSYEKEKAQRELNHKKELDDIEKERQDFLQKRIDAEKEKFEANPKNKGKKFNASSVSLTDAEQIKFNTIRTNTLTKQANEDKEAEEAQEETMRSYLKQYGTYEERRLAITQEYAKKIAKAKSEGEKLSLSKQEQGEYANLDLDRLKKSINWEYIFGNLDNVDAATAGAVKDQLEQFISLSKELTPEQIKTLTDAMAQLQDKMDLAEPLKSIRDARKEYAAAKADYDKYKADLDTAKANGDTAGQKKATEGMITSSQKMTKAKNKEEKSFREVTDIVQDYARALQEAGNVIGGTAGECMTLAASALAAGSAMAEGIDKFGKAVSSMEKAVAILAIIEAALQAIQMIMDVFGDKADTTLTDYVSTMDTYIKLLDDDISSLNNSMGSTKNTMKDTIAYYSQLVALEKDSATAVKSQSQVWLNSGASKGFLGIRSKASEGKKIVEQMKKDLSSGNEEVRRFYEQGYNSLNQFFRKVNGRLAGSVKDFGRMDWIWKLSDEDLAALSKDVNAMALLGDTLSSAVKEYAEKTKNVTDKLNDEFSALLNVSYDDFYEGFTDMISEMDNDSQNFANNFAEYMRKALVKDMIASRYKSQLESLYKRAGQYAENGTLGGHVDELREQYTRLATSAQEQARLIDSITGYSDNDSQKATANGISSITYEQANNIVALTTAGNITRDQTKDILIGRLSSVDISVTGLQSLAKEHNSIADELRTIQANSYIELQGIHEDTTSMSKAIKSMSGDVSDIKKEIKKM